jgi:hypothetical protein
MPETEFYFADSEVEELLATMLTNGTALVPDVRYDSEEYVEIRDPVVAMRYRQNVSYRDGAVQFFVVNPLYTKRPLELSYVHTPKLGEPFWHILPRWGGAHLNVYCPRQVTTNEKRSLGSGSVSYYRSFWNLKRKGEEEPAPKELISFYREITGWIRQKATRVKTEVRTYFVAPEAARLRADGWKLVGLESAPAK